MSRSAWDGSAHMSGDIDGLSTSSSRQSGNNLGISRSQDDATVSYYFQRPQSENDLQAYGGGKRWAIGDDTLVEQVDNLSGVIAVTTSIVSILILGKLTLIIHSLLVFI